MGGRWQERTPPRECSARRGFPGGEGDIPGGCSDCPAGMISTISVSIARIREHA
jgi:hypothetical protein